MNRLPEHGDEPRAAAAIIAEIQNFQPTSDLLSGWKGMAKLVEEAEATGLLAAVVPALFTVFERFPDLWPVFSLWAVVHALDGAAELAAAAVAESLRRRPSAFAAVVACRMVQLGHSRVGDVSLPSLLTQVAHETALPEKIRERLKRNLDFFEIV
jgi:hypothetical protein